MKRILYFFPLNPVDKNSGSRTRALNLLKYFKARDLKVDFITKLVWGLYTPETVQAFRNSGLAENIWVMERKPVKKNPVKYFFSYKLWHILFERKLKLVKGSIPNHTTLNLRKQFDAMLKREQYDYIIISYAYWADLIRDNPLVGKAVTIIDTHDLLASQHQNDVGFDKGAALGDELRRVAQFDQVWAISPEETYFFGQFLKDKVKHIPMMMDTPPVVQPLGEKEFDLVYVATDNPHNLVSSAWFFKEVYPLLSPQLKICVIGPITEHVSADYKNVTRIGFVDDLDEYYLKSKISICPMLSGTGVKVKVVEAMSHGLPVVCSDRGVDGLPDKTNNGCLVTNDPQLFADYIQQLLTNKSLYEEISAQSLASFHKHFSKEEAYKKLDRALGISK
ncbi:glycosyltransferase family 4 protein [Chitinophaga arvensicola]|uniref:Glycosyltransferase involved in cell wall bisynthesis n=1 Tax=Chitinophaga arvensicola TaxID=29529 RepID=A0A1I0S8B5_9BACT|nr:glycosyltransferase family 4 protein [Chitinophaga arvensicola]SEW51980.1 Glycosyltransferase involved in cell wall bisynthesis [Chitinophaga arvensicola]